jgi:hypothetical protein
MFKIEVADLNEIYILWHLPISGFLIDIVRFGLHVDSLDHYEQE